MLALIIKRNRKTVKKILVSPSKHQKSQYKGYAHADVAWPKNLSTMSSAKIRDEFSSNKRKVRGNFPPKPKIFKEALNSQKNFLPNISKCENPNYQI